MTDNPSDKSEQEPAAEGDEPTQPPQQTQPPAQGQGQVQQPVQTGPSVTDIFSRPDTQQAMKTVISTFAIIGVGAGIAGYALLSKFMGGDNLSSGLLGGVLALAALSAIAITGPGIAGVLTLAVDNGLDDLADNLRYATAAVNGLGGFFVYALLAAIILGMKANSGKGEAIIEIGDLITTFVFGGVGAAIASAGVLFLQDKLNQPTPQPASPQPAD